MLVAYSEQNKNLTKFLIKMYIKLQNMLGVSLFILGFLVRCEPDQYINSIILLTGAITFMSEISIFIVLRKRHLKYRFIFFLLSVINFALLNYLLYQIIFKLAEECYYIQALSVFTLSTNIVILICLTSLIFSYTTVVQEN